MNCDEADLGRRGAQRPAPGRHVPSTPKVFGSRGQVWLVGVPAPPGRPCPCVQLIISGARRDLLESAAEYLPEARWQATSVTSSRRSHARESREVADRKARAIVDDLWAAKTSTPRGSWRLRDQCVGETAKQISIWTSCSKGETDAAGCLDDTNFVSIRQLYGFAGKCKSAHDQSLAWRSRIV
jgi:hypothetical protein